MKRQRHSQSGDYLAYLSWPFFNEPNHPLHMLLSPPLFILKRPQSDQLRLRYLTFACLRLHTPSESRSFPIVTRVALGESDFVCLHVVFSHYLVMGNEEKGLAHQLVTVLPVTLEY